MKKVKALQTVHGSYGTKEAGEEFEVTDSVAKELEEKKLVKISGSAGKDPVEEETHTSVTYGEKEKQETRVLAKKTPAGPNAKRK